mmetsp:Transcript_47/g.110  ORF Transcript_47/g.110 Transcript_47/m.110 type:complete len:92 (+) Transcript_47:454-729(+)
MTNRRIEQRTQSFARARVCELVFVLRSGWESRQLPFAPVTSRRGAPTTAGGAQLLLAARAQRPSLATEEEDARRQWQRQCGERGEVWWKVP